MEKINGMKKQIREVLSKYRGNQGYTMEHAESELLNLFKNKKDNWRDKLTKGDYVIGRGLNGLEAWYGYNRLEAEHTFKTKEQAQLLADKMNLMQKMHAFAHARNDGWVPDWEDGNSKWGLTTDSFEGVRLDYYFNLNGFIFGIAVKSEEIAEEMLAEFGERIKEIYNKQY